MTNHTKLVVHTKPVSATITHRQVRIFESAYRQSLISILFGFLAVGCFLLFGTLSTLKQLADNAMIYAGFHYLPYALIALSIPLSLYHVFLSVRYRIIQTRILIIMVMLGVGLLLVSPFMAMIAWFAMPYLFKVNFKRYLTYLMGESAPNDRAPSATQSQG